MIFIKRRKSKSKVKLEAKHHQEASRQDENKGQFSPAYKSVYELIEQAKRSSDFVQTSISNDKGRLIASFYNSMIDDRIYKEYIMKVFKEGGLKAHHFHHIAEVKQHLPIPNIVITDNLQTIGEKMLKGYIVLQLNEGDKVCALINAANDNLGLRKDNNTENEYSVVGPKIGLVENLDVNLHLIRQQMSTNKFVVRELTVGSQSKTRVALLYVENITNPQHVNTMLNRLENIEFDHLMDTSLLDQLVADNSNTPFPLFLTTERVDRVIYSLVNGQVSVMANGSPYAISGPVTLLDFFSTPEDYYLPWIIGSFLRIIRIFGVFFSILATSIYISVLTFHYEMIPEDLLGPIIYSRANVPFPPVFEALFLEITIELLREAGSRLPTKVGQTLGIVGGIVIGQASVEAALTSNILLIIVALAALASFTTPIYKMSNTIRFLRFPFILLASLWGGLGIVMGIIFMFVHLMRLESLGTPYMLPFYPFRAGDFKDSLIRLSLPHNAGRPSYSRPKSKWKYSKREAGQKKDIDE
ncbi:spore germination protein [Marinicrinis lubricantis]|uniref:Spore germination protein n=1 Tax=Marinicrinis lubricantis TaxID=2086470 RepID=A0ABW1IL77_9BACL